MVLVRWDSDLLEFLMQVSVVDGSTLELAEMISGTLHVTALLEQAAEAGDLISQETVPTACARYWSRPCGTGR